MPLVVDPDGVEAATIGELVDLRGKRVLEIGSGDGRLTFGYAEKTASIVAFDQNEESIRDARAATPRRLREKIRFEVANAADVALAESEFDLALFSWSL
jgi:ubiquinone/menaquinone biosynthesis C-methylase UbiE